MYFSLSSIEMLLSLIQKGGSTRNRHGLGRAALAVGQLFSGRQCIKLLGEESASRAHPLRAERLCSSGPCSHSLGPPGTRGSWFQVWVGLEVRPGTCSHPSPAALLRATPLTRKGGTPLFFLDNEMKCTIRACCTQDR